MSRFINRLKISLFNGNQYVKATREVLILSTINLDSYLYHVTTIRTSYQSSLVAGKSLFVNTLLSTFQNSVGCFAVALCIFNPYKLQSFFILNHSFWIQLRF